jgi:hypothetical protein
MLLLLFACILISKKNEMFFTKKVSTLLQVFVDYDIKYDADEMHMQFQTCCHIIMTICMVQSHLWAPGHFMIIKVLKKF